MTEPKHRLNLKINTEGLHGKPTGSGPAVLFQLIIVQMVQGYDEEKSGLNYQEQKLMNGVLQKFEEAIKTNDEAMVLEDGLYKFLIKCRDEGRTRVQINKAFMRVMDALETAETIGGS